VVIKHMFRLATVEGRCGARPYLTAIEKLSQGGAPSPPAEKSSCSVRVILLE